MVSLLRLIQMHKITFKDTSYYIASDDFIENVSNDWKKLTKVIKIVRIKNE